MQTEQPDLELDLELKLKLQLKLQLELTQQTRLCESLLSLAAFLRTFFFVYP